MNNPATRTIRACIIAVAFFCVASVISAAPPARKATTPNLRGTDAAWTKDFAVPNVPSNQLQGRENALNWAPRFLPLLQSSFPQKQWFWYDHHHFTPVSGLVQTFMGVPGDVILDDDRYVTADGCVPHACAGYRGMLWIDSSAHPAVLIFAAINMVNNESGKEADHLWLFTSKKLNWTHLPQPFLSSLQHWQQKLAAKGYMGTTGYHYNFLVATIVQPNGEMVDISPTVLRLGTSASGAKQ